MALRLRQICLVAPMLEPSVSNICGVLGTVVTYIDPLVGAYGLINALMPFGNSFLEVVAPVEDGTAAGRYLARRRGEGGYMVILDCDNIEPWFARLAAVGVRVANDLNHDGVYRGLQLHPRDTGGALLEINCSHDGAWNGPYYPAGPRWRGADDDEQIMAAELQSPDPSRLAGIVTGTIAPALAEPTELEAVADDLWALGVTPDATALSLMRPELDRRGVVTAGSLSTQLAARVCVAGAVTHRQHPESAHGAVFLNLEDETGHANVVFSRGAWVRWRHLARRAPALVIHGRLERAQGVVNVVAERVEALELRAPVPGSRDFR